MPIFEYSCKKCGATFEKILNKAEKEITCPRCGGTATRTVSTTSAGPAISSGCG